jgi:hypothetical protein
MKWICALALMVAGFVSANVLGGGGSVPAAEASIFDPSFQCICGARCPTGPGFCAPGGSGRCLKAAPICD